MDPRLQKLPIEIDLQERLKRTEEALRARELNVQLIVDSIPAPAAVITPTGEVEAVNQPVLDYFGKTLEELKGWASSDQVHPDDLPHVIKVRRQALERDQVLKNVIGLRAEVYGLTSSEQTTAR